MTVNKWLAMRASSCADTTARGFVAAKMPDPGQGLSVVFRRLRQMTDGKQAQLARNAARRSSIRCCCHASSRLR